VLCDMCRQGKSQCKDTDKGKAGCYGHLKKK
jgi:hypothetical protein